MPSDYKFDLAGERVFLTGGGRGMGRGIAEAFAGWGAVVGVTDIDESGAHSTAEGIAASGGQAYSHAIDVTDEHSVEVALDAFLEFAGGVDLTVNAAGVLSVHSVVDMEVAEWRRILDVNATGTFIVARAAAQAMIARNLTGSIACISSVGGKKGAPHISHYAASKFAVVGFVQSASRELGQHGIRVNAVCPGTVDTQMIKDLGKGWSINMEDFLDLQVIKRPQTPAEIATGIASLHINQAITGQSINIDGGTVFY